MKESGVSSPANSDWAGACEIFLNVDSCRLAVVCVCMRGCVCVFMYLLVCQSICVFVNGITCMTGCPSAGLSVCLEL